MPTRAHRARLAQLCALAVIFVVRKPMGRNGFISATSFPLVELEEFGAVVTAIQHAGFEVRHCEDLREHYALTLRAWVANPERHYGEAVSLVGPGRARVWRLYVAGSALAFEAGDIVVQRALAVRNQGGRSAMAQRPDW